jgi:copper(I)-binding protein
LLAGAIAVASETQTYKVGQLVIETPWTWATSAWAQVVGGNLKITNTGADADRLIGGTLPVAATAEVHEMACTTAL